MGNRYLVTGVQLGILIALPTMEERQKYVEQITNIQYVDISGKVVDCCIELNKKLDKNKRKNGKRKK